MGRTQRIGVLLSYDLRLVRDYRVPVSVHGKARKKLIYGLNLGLFSQDTCSRQGSVKKIWEKSHEILTEMEGVMFCLAGSFFTKFGRLLRKTKHGNLPDKWCVMLAKIVVPNMCAASDKRSCLDFT